MKIITLNETKLINKKNIEKSLIEKILNKHIKNINNDNLRNDLHNNLNIENLKLMPITIKNKKYLMKTIVIDISNKYEYDKEISNISKINKINRIKDYLVNCMYLIKSDDLLLSIFEYIKSITIKKYISNIINEKEKKKEKLTRYLINMLLKSINELHKSNICHLQININNILVSLKTEYLKGKNMYKKNDPLVIKYINFNLNTRTEKDKYIEKKNIKKIDPYIDLLKDKYISLTNCKKYDIWCIGLIIMKLILKENIFYELLKKKFKIENNKDFQSKKILVSKNYKLIYENCVKYIFTNIKNRENGEFILNKIILDEKHNN